MKGENEYGIDAGKMYTVAELAAFLKVSENTIRNRCADGSILASQVSNSDNYRVYRIHGGEILRYLRQGARGSLPF